MLYSYTRIPGIPDSYLSNINAYDIFAAGCRHDTPGPNANYQRAYKCLEEARIRGHILASTRLGIMYYEGRAHESSAIPKEPKRAHTRFLYAAGLGDPIAMKYLATCYQFGHGTQPNEGLAEFWHMLSIETAELKPNMAFAPPTEEQSYSIDAEDIYAAGQFHRENNEDNLAGRCYWQAAMQGHMGATSALGSFFGQGRGGLAKNEAKAYHLIRIAAEGGHPVAMKNLSDCYLKGFGTEKNDVLAAHWLKAYEAICPAPVSSTPASSSSYTDASTALHTSASPATQAPSTSSGLGQISCLFRLSISLAPPSEQSSLREEPVTLGLPVASLDACNPF